MNKANKERLQALHVAAQHALNPSFPLAYIPPYSKRDNSTNGLQSCIIDFLNYSGWQAERINTMGRKIGKKEVYVDVVGFARIIGSERWIKGTGTKGSADISATIKGRSVKVEVKYGKDRQSSDQKKYEQEVTQAGGVYLIAKTFDGFIDWYDAFLSQI
jgi:hypothetical protein